MEERLLGSEAKYESNLKGRIWTESKKLWRIALPAMLARVSQYGMFVVTQGFIGHIGDVQLAAYALIQIIAVRFANGILLGMSSATETLCGQAFGAKQYHMMGIYLQRSLLINIATGTVLLPVFIFAGDIFKLLGEDSDIAAKAGYISLWFIPILYFFVFCLTIQKYLQAQLKNIIVGWLSAVAFVMHVILSWIFVNLLNLGIPGAMGAMIIASWFIVIGEFVYLFGGWCPNTWNGFCLAAFVDLLPVLKLSVSSGVMLCLELWYNAILVLLSGYMKNATTEISAFSICVRISNELGKGDAKTASFSVKVAIITATIIGTFFFIICLLFSHGITKIFTSSEEVISSVSSLSVLLALSVFLNGLQAVLSGVAVGAGRQTLVAYVNLCCYYIIGIPVGVLLAYVADMKVKGIWIGMMVGVATQVLTLGFITYKTDWDQQVDEATARLDRWLLKPSDESTGN
ncbi:protein DETOXIFICATION 24-like isoform X2 [Mangifera indica]|uniref:protein DETOXIFICATION 24-like isoform X2 n=1 Tax=Mangifera indica TaxID=29780 RepID=UPI001CFAF6C8|nr:protein DETOXIFICATION 24-like isoform X2 [Mangifera indica]